MYVQEAVADRVNWSSVSRAHIPRVVRLLSFLHGTPEATPVVEGWPAFSRAQPDGASIDAHVAWQCDDEDWLHPINIFTRRLVDNGQLVNMPEWRRWYYVRVSQLEGVLEDLAMLKDLGDYQGLYTELELFLSAAVEHGEAVLLRERE
jgi:hypothetical protein